MGLEAPTRFGLCDILRINYRVAKSIWRQMLFGYYGTCNGGGDNDELVGLGNASPLSLYCD